MEWPPSTPISEAILPSCGCAMIVRGAEAISKVVGIRWTMRWIDVDLFERHLVTAVSFLPCRSGDVGAPELGTDAARPEARDVGHQPRLRLGNVEVGER